MRLLSSQSSRDVKNDFVEFGLFDRANLISPATCSGACNAGALGGARERHTSVASLWELGRRRYRETYRATAVAVERGTRALIGGGGVSPPVSDGDTACSYRPVPRESRRVSLSRRCSSRIRVCQSSSASAISVIELSLSLSGLPEKQPTRGALTPGNPEAEGRNRSIGDFGEFPDLNRAWIPRGGPEIS